MGGSGRFLGGFRGFGGTTPRRISRFRVPFAGGLEEAADFAAIVKGFVALVGASDRPDPSSLGAIVVWLLKNKLKTIMVTWWGAFFSALLLKIFLS